MTSTGKINCVFFTNGTASHAWRIDGIADWLNNETEEHAVYVTEWTKWNGVLPQGTNLVIMEMLTSPDMVKECQAQGAKVIYEADDAMLDSYGKERKNLMQIGDHHRERTIETIKNVDALMVTNEHLKENHAKFTDKPIYVVPNYINYDWYGEGRLNIERTTDEVRLGWFGSRGHLEDLKMISPVIGRLLDKYPQLKFIYCGFGGMSSDKISTEASWGEDVFKELPRDRREFAVGVREDAWPMKHRTLDFDIGICPLVDDYFNKCKTPIKWMEFGILETPSVCSPVLYKDVVEHGKTGYLATTEEEWFEHLSKLIENKDLRKKIGKNASEEVKKKYNLKDHLQDFLDIYMEVVYGKA